MAADLLRRTADIVAAYASNHELSPRALNELISEVFVALSSLDSVSTQQQRAPAVDPNQSVFPDYVICLEDGQRLRTLRRHLMLAHGLTSDQYRERWGLPSHYPMSAPNYVKAQSNIVKNQRRRTA